MDWWNELTDWTASDNGWRVLSGAIIPFVAIVVAGVVAALIGRGATKRVVALQEREAKNAAVAAIISAARKAATWGSLGHEERAYADHLAEDADVRLRLLPVSGAPLAANWAQHEIADIKKNSSTFSFQAEQSLAEFRDRLLEWQARPARARKLFKHDLERWKFETPDPDADLVRRQQDWNADQAAGRVAAPSTPTTTALRQPGGASSPAPSATVGDSAAASTSGTGSASVTSGTAQTPPTAGSSAPGAASSSTTSLSDDGRPLSDGLTRPYGDDVAASASGSAPMRPTLGTPTRATAEDAQDDDAVDDRADTVALDGDESNPSAVDRPVPPPVARPTAADAHVNRPASTVATPATRSVPTRVHGAPAEPADADETDEAPYTQPISASELRRRSSDDD